MCTGIEGDTMRVKVYHHIQGVTFTTWENVKILFICRPGGVRVKWADGTISMVEEKNLMPAEAQKLVSGLEAEVAQKDARIAELIGERDSLMDQCHALQRLADERDGLRMRVATLEKALIEEGQVEVPCPPAVVSERYHERRE